VLLVGRDAERERIDRLVDGARRGQSGVLVLRGEAGIGKTALLRYAIERADSMLVVRATGVESEAELEYSGLLEICRPLLPWLDSLADHQAQTLRVALGLADGRQLDRFGVGAATLALFAAAADDQPLLVVIDDAHWLDDASAGAIRFAARRLLADRVAVLFAVRESDARSFAPDGFDEQGLEGLTAADAQLLLGSITDTAVPAEVAASLWTETGGNPLALVELPQLLDEAQLAGHVALYEPLPASAGVERAFARRLDRVDPDCRQALVVLATASTRELAPAITALASLGLDAAALERAEAVGLLELDEARFVFRHPLLRAVVHQTASASDRRRANRALAAALVRPGDEERRAWHLAAAALGPDMVAADALAVAASRARDRSGFAAASAAYERAARLSPDDADRVERLADAAQTAWEGGAAERALALVEEALADALEPRLRARLLELGGRIALQAGVLADARAQLQEAAQIVREVDREAAAGALTYAVFCCHFEGRIEEGLELARTARSLVASDGGGSDLRVDYVLGRSLLLAGRGEEGTPLLERMVAAAAEEDAIRTRIAAAAIVLSVLERPGRQELLTRALALARDEGPMALVYALSIGAETELRAGRLKRAVASATEGLALARELGQSNIAATMQVVLARVEAMRGRDDAYRSAAADAVPALAGAGMRLPLEQLRCSQGLVELGTGRFEEAVSTFEACARGVTEMGVFDRDVLPEPDLVEALLRLGRAEEAAAVLAAWEARGVPREVPLAGALAARCRGLLADDDGFAVEFTQALERHGEIEDAFGKARTRLCFGERLRRKGHRVEARRELHAGLEVFERLEAAPWVERARSELRASGERLRRREEARDELTPQELQVALQVAEGKTNKEVAAAMFLSPKTVEFHLGRIFRKLDVSSRTELARRISSDAPTLVAV
jgi:DNA-binding CsgD family transcriptional regulator